MSQARGFTLVELAISLAIIGLLLGMLVVPLNAQVDQQRTSDTQKHLQVIHDAIIGFTVANGRLPCPAISTTANTTAGAGTESRNTAVVPAACTNTEGVVPWATLGIAETDAWGRRFTYRITPEFANDAVGGLQATFTLTDNGALTVTNGTINIATNVVAAVVSHGKNGLGAYQMTGIQIGGASGDELANANADNTFVAKTPEPAFDDLVTWVSPNVLKSRMIAANRLP
jgi:prepilin-type N-terminal cleavage/methylation domain-containing protein